MSMQIINELLMKVNTHSIIVTYQLTYVKYDLYRTMGLSPLYFRFVILTGML